MDKTGDCISWTEVVPKDTPSSSYSNKDLMERDEQIGGTHYNNKAIQPIDYILQNNLPYCEANIVKYVTRHKEKNGAEDIRKAIHYLRFILAYDYNETL